LIILCYSIEMSDKAEGMASGRVIFQPRVHTNCINGSSNPLLATKNYNVPSPMIEMDCQQYGSNLAT
jgi:hypothetical protein